MANLAQAFGKAAQTFANVYVSERARQDEMKEEQRWKEFYGRLAEGQFNLQKEQADREQERFTYQMERDRKQDEQELAKLEAYDQTARANGYRDWNTFQALSDVEKQQVFMNQSRLEEQLINLRMTEIKHGMAMQSQAAARAAADKKSKEFEVIMELTDKTGDPTLAQELYALDKKIKAGVGNDEDMKNYADMTKRAQELAVKRNAELEKLAGKGGSGGVNDSTAFNILGGGGSPEQRAELLSLLNRRDSWTEQDAVKAASLMSETSRTESPDLTALDRQRTMALELYGTPIKDPLDDTKITGYAPPTEGPGKAVLDGLNSQINAVLLSASGVGDPSSPGMPAAPVEPLGAYRSQTMADVAKSAGTEDITSMTFYPKGNPAAATTVPKTSPNLASLLDGVNKGVLEVAKGDQHKAAADDYKMMTDATGNDPGAVVAQILGGFVTKGFDNQIGAQVFEDIPGRLLRARKTLYPNAPDLESIKSFVFQEPEKKKR